ncbi:MAG: nicotinate-nucleotide--dimethylbenzimidazole phosphoribosyltransferase [Pseudomonadota bacterium]
MSSTAPQTDAPFDSLAEFRAVLARAPGRNGPAEAQARARNEVLTKPPGALGRLEDLAIWVAAWQGTDRPRLDAPQVVIFAANHGVTAKGVSAFPADVTAQMVANFEAGGAAINQLSKTFGAQMTVHPIKLETPTADFTEGPAMSEADLIAALTIGWNAVDPAAHLLVAGEMGIGNTTAAAAICAALYGGIAEDWVGRGTGVDEDGLSRKAAAVASALTANADALGDPLEVLRCLGGRELAAMVGAIARARADGIPVLLDGFICCAAAACLAEAQKGALDHALAAHLSAEGAHGALLEKLGKMPILSLGLRLGEGSGAALALGVLKGAVACHSGMATFAEAGVSDS